MVHRRRGFVAGALVLVVVLVLGISSLGGHSNATKGATGTAVRTVAVSSQQVTIDDHARAVTVISPKRPDGALLAVLPGLAETPTAVRAASDADSLAFAEGVTIAYVGGYQDSWNAGSCCAGALTAKIDDVGAIRSITQAIVAQNHLDAHRVFVAGHGNGAFMVLRLACETQAVYAGFLSVSGALVVACPDPTPTPIVFWQGTLDKTVPLDGGAAGGSVLPPLTTTLAPFTATCGTPVQAAADSTTASYAWSCSTGGRLLLLDSAGTDVWPGPPGQLIARAWRQLGAQRADAGV